MKGEKKKKITNEEAEAYNTISMVINEQFEALAEAERPPVLPCIRTLPNGSTEIYNCKTGETIPTP